jgi:hypothetical protein
MGRDDDWIPGGEWIRGDERESGGEWVSGGAGRRIGYGETTVAPGVAWTTVWGAEAEEDAEEEADEDDWPDDDWPEDDWPEDGWPDDEWLDGESFAAPGGPMGPMGQGRPMGRGGPMGTPGRPAGPGSGFGYRTGGWGHGGVPGFSARMAVAVAVVAAVAGVAAGFILTRGAPVASAAGGAMPSVPAPGSAPPSAGRGAGPRALPGLPGNAGGNGDEQLRMLLTGRVLAVSRTSVTIGGAGPSVTASVTSTTRLTGRVHALSGVKVGDEVTAQITGTPSHLVITTLQDPAQ